MPAVATASCWVGGFSREFCCDPKHGPMGNKACWDQVFTYDPCCTKLDSGSEDSGLSTSSGSGGLERAESEMLERAFGAKLDHSLIENNFTIAQMEEDLRTTISTPENRSMAGPMSHGYLALLLDRQGRSAEAAVEFWRFSSGGLSIDGNGAWVGASAEGYHMHDAPFSEALVAFFRDRGASTVGDFGCGLGLYVRDLRDAGFRSGGFDGNPATAEITKGRCQQLDLSKEVDFGTRWDWVLSLEVAEHIPPEFEDTFVGNLDRHARAGLVLSWGNQAGEGHVNNRARDEVERIFAARGFRSEVPSAATLRGAARLPWLRNTVLVLVRETAAS